MTCKRQPSRSQRRQALARLLLGTLVTISSGCGLIRKIPHGKHDTRKSYHDNHGLAIEYPEVARCAETPPTLAARAAAAPHSLEDPAEIPAYELSLEEAIHMAVDLSPVLRTFGGTIVTAPQATATVYDPGLASASPTQGTEAALAAFDAQYTQSLFWFTQDRPNNIASGGLGAVFTPSALVGTNATFSNDLSKQTAQGARFALRHVVNYTRNNQPFRAFSSAFDGFLEAEWRQPLMQGAGTEFNRIAGPSTIPGQYNGVLIARVNEDVALTDFEAGMIQLVSDVEQAYWDLVTAYRVLDSNVLGRNAAQQTWQYQQVRLEIGEGRSDEEAQARSQYFQFKSQVESALGASGGLYDAEQRLRYLIGLPASDGRLIRPTTQPIDVKVVFDWENALGQSLTRRVEVRRQLLAVQRRELELTAARLNRRPRLDFLAQYRWNGLGNHLIGRSGGSPLNNFYGSLTGDNYQEAQAGFEMNLPVGLRTASVAVAHARLNLRRERALLAETELRISHDLSEAARTVELTHRLVETNYNRFVADMRQVDVLRRRYRDGQDNINFLLQAQRQVVTSATEFYRSMSAYNLAIRDFHREKGSLLAYNQVQLAEGPWAAGAQRDAYEVGRFLTPRHSPEKTYVPRPLSSGPFDPSAIQSTNAAGTQPTPGSGPIDQSDGSGRIVPDPTTEPLPDPADTSPQPIIVPQVGPVTDQRTAPAPVTEPAAEPTFEPRLDPASPGEEIGGLPDVDL